MSTSTKVIVTALLAAGCGGGGDGPGAADARAPDAATPQPDAPACPDFVAAMPEFHDSFMADDAPLRIGVRTFVGTDNTGDLLVAAFDETQAQTGVDFDPVFETAPAHLELWWNVDADLIPQMQFATISGTLNLSHACANGVAGTLTDGVFQQVTPGGNDLAAARVDGGCTFTVPSLAFVIGDTCP